MARWLTFALSAFFLLPAFASSASPESDSQGSIQGIMRRTPPDEADYAQFLVLLKDDPMQVFRDLHQLWLTARQNRDFRLEAQAGWYIARAASYDLKDYDGWDMNALFRDTIQLIQTHRLPISTQEIEFFELIFQHASHPQGYSPVLTQLLALIRQIDNPSIKAYALSLVVYDLASRGINQDLPRYFSDLRAYLQGHGEDLRIIDVDTLTGFSLALEQIGQTAEARLIMDKLDALCVSRVLREFCSSRAYESGRAALNAGDPSQALAAFARSLELSTAINDVRRIALSYYGLGTTKHKLEDHAAAVPYIQKAVAMFTGLDMKDWAAAASNNLSKIYLSMGRNQDALKAAQEALALCPDGFKIDRMTIYQQLAATYEKLDRPWDALRYLKLYGDLDRETSADDAQKKYMQLRNESLSAQNEMQAAQINLLERFRLVSILAAGLSLFLIAAMIGIVLQSRMVRSSQRKMREILDHIAEGILILDQQLRIGSGYSPYLDEIFGSQGSSLTGRPFLEILFPPDLPDQKETLNLAQAALLACIGEGSWSWDFNQGHLPHEVQYKGMTLAIHWQPLYNSQQQIQSFLVSVRDESQLRAMQQYALQQAQRVQQLHSKLQEILAGKPAMMRQLLQQMRDEWDGLQTGLRTGDGRAQTLRRLHTFKGAARTLGLKELAGQMHELESLLINANHANPSQLEEHWTQLGTVLADYDHLLNSLMTTKPGEASTRTDLYTYASLYAAEADSRLQEAQRSLQGLRVLDQIRHWDPKALAQIHEIILHAISNAIDHGFVRSEGTAVMAPALIEIEATYQDQAIRLTIADNGRGIDMNFIRDKVQALGFVPESGRPITDILFLDGLSTASSVSHTSGRGVGLSAIQSICRELKAMPEISPRIGGGTQLTIILPLSVVR